MEKVTTFPRFSKAVVDGEADLWNTVKRCTKHVLNRSWARSCHGHCVLAKGGPQLLNVQLWQHKLHETTTLKAAKASEGNRWESWELEISVSCSKEDFGNSEEVPVPLRSRSIPPSFAASAYHPSFRAERRATRVITRGEAFRTLRSSVVILLSFLSAALARLRALIFTPQHVSTALIFTS